MIETKIIDNFLPKDVFDNFVNPLLRGEIPLHYVYSEKVDFFQFEHRYYNQKLIDVGSETLYCCGSSTQTFDAVAPVTALIGRAIVEHTHPSEVALVRAKINVVPRTGTKMQEGFHTDLSSPHAVGLLYMNTTNGPTVFEDGEEIDSVENRLVIFDGLRPHTSSSCTDKKIRAAFNTNYFVIEDRAVE
jgi:hypothetical protein